MAARRILCLWLPRLAAERALRRPALAHLALAPDPVPFALVEETAGAVRLVSLDAAAEALGLRPGLTLADARALHPALVTAVRDPGGEARFRASLLRWARRFSPWAGPDDAAPGSGPGEGGLALDISGCAHLFGGEEAMAALMIEELAALGLTARAGIADSRGAAWALARFAAGGAAADPAPGRGAEAIRVDARATRVRSPSRPAPGGRAGPAAAAGVAVASPGANRAAIAELPVAALRLPAQTREGLARLGLRRIADLAGIPRAALARRFGADLVLRLDQALGATPEPVSPAAPPRPFAVRLTLPEPVGLRADLEAALDRLLARLCARLEAEGQGARRLRLAIRRVDGIEQADELGLARPGRDPARLAPLFERILDGFDAGFGVEAVRLEAIVAEPIPSGAHHGRLVAEAEAAARAARRPDDGARLDDLLARLGARIGLDRLLRLQPADSHIPEKTARLAAAAYCEAAAGPWPAPPVPRPSALFGPEPVAPSAPGRPPPAFRWRRAERHVARAAGPERIAPEWWLDDPAWRTGPRDYWRVETETGERLWLFEARGRPGAALGEQGGWFVHGAFA
ncbi:MAG: Y-family DNA polymerase [Pseudomonadota bacterium]